MLSKVIHRSLVLLRGGDVRFGRSAVTVAAAMAVFLSGILGGCSQGRDPQTFIEKLDAKSPEVRSKAVDELIRMRDEAVPAVMEAFLEAPKSEAGLRRVQSAVDVLKQTRTLDALQTLAKRADDENADVRLAVTQGVAELAQVRKKLGIDLLEKAMEDPDPRIVEAAATGLRRMNFEDATAVLEDFFQAGEGLPAVHAAGNLYTIDRRPSAARYLLQKAASENSEIKEAARSSAVSLGSGRAVGERFIAFAVGYAVENPGARQVEEVQKQIRDNLFSELEKTLPPKRYRAIMTALGRMADPESVNRLITILEGEDDYVTDVSSRIAAAEALGHAAGSSRPGGSDPLRRETLTTLGGILEKEQIEDRIAIAASISLCRLRQENGVSYLLDQLQALEEPDEETEGEEEEVVVPEEEEEITELRIRAQEALTTSGEFVVPFLLAELKQGDAGRIVSWAAARTLGDLRVEKAVPHLAQMLTATTSPAEIQNQPGDPDPKVELTTETEPIELDTSRSAVLQILFGSREVIPARPLSVRMAAARGLGRIGGEEATSALEEGRRVHENVDEGVGEFLRTREYTRLIPAEAIIDTEKTTARETLQQVAQNLQRDAEKVLFYIRQGQKKLAAAEPAEAGAPE